MWRTVKVRPTLANVADRKGPPYTPKADVKPFETRRAGPSDAEAIELAHRDSIRSLGPAFYPANVVSDWQEGLHAGLYRKAMEAGEVFFIATAQLDEGAVVLGFASDYVIEGTRHGASVYVRGIAARRGIGSALLRLAEAHAVESGATSIHVEASLAGVEFYRANGFIETGRGDTPLMSGRPIACVFMRKELAALTPRADQGLPNRQAEK
jgi:ribosomal protein S18 acetylase RimI-like enzyme